MTISEKDSKGLPEVTKLNHSQDTHNISEGMVTRPADNRFVGSVGSLSM